MCMRRVNNPERNDLFQAKFVRVGDFTSSSVGLGVVELWKRYY